MMSGSDVTRVIHIKDAPPGWRSNPDYVYIGRGSKWGNEYSHLSKSLAKYKVQTRDEACEMFEKNQLPKLLSDIHELQGKILVCYCHPQRCHGHPLAREANLTCL